VWRYLCNLPVMKTKPFEMFYFDDQTFIALCRSVEQEVKGLKDASGHNFTELRLAYEKFELFLTVYYRSKGRDDIDYKTEMRESIAMDLNLPVESAEENVTAEYRREKFLEAREKLVKVMEDILYQIRVVTI
jgi:hypothetical protein